MVEGVRVADSCVRYAVSENGLLVYDPAASAPGNQLVWFDRNGVETPVTAAKREFEDLHLSPDGQTLALTIEGDETDIWLYDFARDSFSRLTTGGGNRDPLFTPDGKRVVYNSAKASSNLFWRPVDGSAPEERLTTADVSQYAQSWTPDGRAMLISDMANGQVRSWLQTFNPPGQPALFMTFAAGSDRSDSVLSRDGRWLAYMDAGQVHLQPFPGPGPKVQVSTDGGLEPVWSHDGRELFYRDGAKIMAVQVWQAVGNAPSVSRPKLLFEGTEWIAGRDYDITPDDKRFIMIRGPRQSDSKQLNIVQNWLEEVKQKVH
jgi:Tol biopolymer transport system component